jgi:hypothetical protein
MRMSKAFSILMGFVLANCEVLIGADPGAFRLMTRNFYPKIDGVGYAVFVQSTGAPPIKPLLCVVVKEARPDFGSDVTDDFQRVRISVSGHDHEIVPTAEEVFLVGESGQMLRKIPLKWTAVLGADWSKAGNQDASVVELVKKVLRREKDFKKREAERSHPK